MMEEARRPNELRCVLFEEEGAWNAICLEHYIGSQGRTLEEAQQRLKCAYRAELDHSIRHGGRAFHGIMPAPARFHEMWNEGGPDIMRRTIYDRHGHAEALAA